MGRRSGADFDLAVIGLGSAGMVAVDFACRLGLRTVAVESSRVGGDCLWTGCVPSKSLLAAASAAQAIRTADRFGIKAAEPELDLSSIWRRIARVQAEIAARDDDPEKLSQKGAEVMVGVPARILGPHKIAVGGREIKARFILICTGSRPAVPSIPGLAEAGFVTSENFFQLERVPSKLLFIGGGPISLELAQAMRRLGQEVTVLEAAEQIAGREEPELASTLLAILRSEGVVVETSVEIVHVSSKDGSKTVTARVGGQDRTWTGEEIFLGTGRIPNIEKLGLEEVGVRVGRAGIEVDQSLRTTVPSIYACGDVTGRYLFTHSAGHDAVQALRGMFFPGRGRASSLVPWCTFTDPQLAHVGKTLAEASATHRQVEVWRSELIHSDRASADGATLGEVMLITAKGRLVGAHILAPGAGEMIHELALAISERLRIDAVYNLVHIYPTYSTSVGEAAAQAGLQRAGRLAWLIRAGARG